MKKSILLFTLVILANPLLAQNRFAIGYQGGISKLSPETVTVPNQLQSFEARGAGGVHMLLYGRYFLNHSLSFRLGGGINSMMTSNRMENQNNYNSSFSGVKGQAMASIDYDIPFGESKYGVIASLGLNITNNPSSLKNQEIISDEGVVYSGLRIRQDDGSLEERVILLHEMETYGSGGDFVYHIRPELAVYRMMGKHRIFASVIYGHALGKDFYVVDYRDISFMGDRHAARHRFSGSFTAFQIGYEFKL